MVTGVIFYWFSWVFWVIITFLMKKDKIRTILAYWVLLAIIGSAFYFYIGYYQVSLTLIILFLGSILFLSKQDRLLYKLFSSFIVSIGYAALLFWEKVSPIWLILPRTLLITILMAVLISLFCQQLNGKLSIAVFGMLCGEIIFSLILYSYGLQKVIGEMLFLDTLTTTLLILLLLDILRKGKKKLSFHNSKLQQKLEVAK